MTRFGNEGGPVRSRPARPVRRHVLRSAVGAGAAFARTGPAERDTRGMADSARIDEPWIGALILGPAVLDAWRYFDPDAKWAVWVSRAMKIGGVLLILR